MLSRWRAHAAARLPCAISVLADISNNGLHTRAEAMTCKPISPTSERALVLWRKLCAEALRRFTTPVYPAQLASFLLRKHPKGLARSTARRTNMAGRQTAPITNNHPGRSTCRQAGKHSPCQQPPPGQSRQKSFSGTQGSVETSCLPCSTQPHWPKCWGLSAAGSQQWQSERMWQST